MLLNLLNTLQNQKTDRLFTYSAVVVDNDSSQSAKGQVQEFKNGSAIDIDYYIEPEQNIALARNRAVSNAKGTFVAFIDDDEFPDNNWLLNLYNAHREFKADGVLGPVKPHFETMPPDWIIKGKFCERSSFATGTILRNHINTRTGNVLLDRKLFQDMDRPFDPRYGKTGGEDTAFFKNMMEKGNKFVWCNEAAVYENVPKQRLTRAYVLKRALLRGMVNSRNMSIISFGTFKSLLAVAVYTTALPFLLIGGQHLFMKYLVKNFDHMGKLLALFGVNVINDRANLENSM